MSKDRPFCRKPLARVTALAALTVSLAFGAARLNAQTGCTPNPTPFTDLGAMPSVFCQAVAEAYFTGLTGGTTPTTYEPFTTVNRGQMAAFITRTLDQSLRRGNRRAAAQQWWTPQSSGVLRGTDLGIANAPSGIVWDGLDLWVASKVSDTVSRVRASDGKLLQTWTGASNAEAVIAAAGRIFVTGESSGGKVYVINPDEAAGAVAVFETNVGSNPVAITFDGLNLWTANAGFGSGGSLTRINVVNGAETTFTVGFTAPGNVLWDGENLWVTDNAAVSRVNPASGLVPQTLAAGTIPSALLFDGANLWVSSYGSSNITVVRAVGGLRGTALATLTGNGLDHPTGLAFDGERVLAVNYLGPSVSLFKAADLTPLGEVLTGATSGPYKACSDGLNFWVTRQNLDDVVRF